MTNTATQSATLQYRLKSVYGRDLIYPANEAAEIIAQLTGARTLNGRVLEMAEKLGFKTERVL
jgi:uncharacterized protein (DUF697 family)